MWRLTRAWPGVLVVLLVAPACGGGSPTSPSFGSYFKICQSPTYGAMTATLDGTSWVPVMTRASNVGSSQGVQLVASDCTYEVMIDILGVRGPGTYEVARGEVSARLMCDSTLCGPWSAGASTDVFGKTEVTGSGSVTVTAYTAPTPGEVVSGAIEGTFSFTLVENTGLGGPIRTRVMTNGRFGSRFLPGL